jgi:outer membrane protein
MNNKLLSLATVLAVLGTSGAAMAQGWNVKVGALRYDTSSKSDGIRGIGVPPGADAVVGDASTVVFTIERRFGENLGAELAIGIPPRVKARGAGSVAFLGDDVLSAKNFGPTFLVNYHFGSQGAALRPYLGLGVNYTWFKSVKSKLAPDVYMTDSWGLAAHAGIDWALAKNVGVYASIARIDVRTELMAVGSSVLTTSIDFRPWTYSAGVRFSF